MWFSRRMLRMPRTNHVCNEEVLRKIRVTRKRILTMRKRQLNFLQHIIRKEGQKILILTLHIPRQGKQDKTKSNQMARFSWSKVPLLWYDLFPTASLISKSSESHLPAHTHLTPKQRLNGNSIVAFTFSELSCTIKGVFLPLTTCLILFNDNDRISLQLEVTVSMMAPNKK